MKILLYEFYQLQRQSKSALLVLLLFPVFLFSQGQVYWQTNGIAVCDSFYDGGSRSIAITHDDRNNSIILWADHRGMGGYESIYAQKVDVNGNPLWSRNGLCISLSANNPIEFGCASDGLNGAILVWNSWGDVWAQRMDSNGIRRWGANGIRVVVSNSDQYSPSVVGDGSGGAIIALLEVKDPDQFRLILQKRDKDGILWWEHVISDRVRNYSWIESDGHGGAFVAWAESLPTTKRDVFAQWIDSSGVFRWGPSGKRVYVGQESQMTYYGTVARNGVNGVVVQWYNNLGNEDIYSQRLDSTGSRLWDTLGVPVCTLSGMQIRVNSIADGNQEVLIVWVDRRSSNYADLYAQNIDSSGRTHWTTNGVFVAQAARDTGQNVWEIFPEMAGDGRRGFIVTYRYLSPTTNWDVYAQRVDSSGALRWGPGGLPVCTTPIRTPRWGPVITEDGSGGAVIAWGEIRISGYPGLYAQRVGDRTGVEEKRSVDFARDTGVRLQIVQDPGLSGNLRIRYSIPKVSKVKLVIYNSLGQVEGVLVDDQAIPGVYEKAVKNTLSSGVYFVHFDSGKGVIGEKVVVIR